MSAFPAERARDQTQATQFTHSSRGKTRGSSRQIRPLRAAGNHRLNFFPSAGAGTPDHFGPTPTRPPSDHHIPPGQSLNALRSVGIRAEVVGWQTIRFGPVLTARARWLEASGRLAHGSGAAPLDDDVTRRASPMCDLVQPCSVTSRRLGTATVHGQHSPCRESNTTASQGVWR